VEISKQKLSENNKRREKPPISKRKVARNVYFGETEISHILNNNPNLKQKLMRSKKQRKTLNLSFKELMDLKSPSKKSTRRQSPAKRTSPSPRH